MEGLIAELYALCYNSDTPQTKLAGLLLISWKQNQTHKRKRHTTENTWNQTYNRE